MGEAARITIAVALTIGLVIVCTTGPLLLARRIHPVAGCMAGIVAAIVWTRLVRPMPGFLQGIVSLTGFAAIIAVLLTCFATCF